MKFSLRMASALLSLLLLAGCLGCTPRGNGETTTETEAETTGIRVDGLLVCTSNRAPYTVVRSGQADDTVKEAAAKLRRELCAVSGNNDIGVKEDWVPEGGTVTNTDLEILVGATNRAESAACAAALPGILDFSITVTDTKICIYATDSSRVADAVDCFLASLTATDTGSERVVTYTGAALVLDSYDYPLADCKIGSDALSSVRIVLPAAADENEKDLAARLRAFLGRATGKLPPIVTDATPAGGCAEIVIGQTDRGIIDAAIPAGEYRVKLRGRTLFIQSPDSAAYYGAALPIETIISTPDRLTADFTETLRAGITLDGKNVLFIGNSMLYHGNCVINGDQQSPDLGYFYRLCAANGEQCTVYDCTWSGHGLREFISACDTDHHGADHLADYPLDDIDYVILCQVTEREDLTAVCRQIAARFPNPKTQFLYLCSTYTYQQNSTGMIAQLPALQQAGFTVVNCGELCYDLWRGTATVPGTKLTYNKSSFIVNKNDTYHPNLLTGYIEALMCYCAITGHPALGQPYDFATDQTLDASFGTAAFIRDYYTPGSTNFDKIFASAADMAAIQELIDRTNEKWGANRGIAQ